MSETQPLLRIPDQAYGSRGIPVPQGAFELHQPEQGPVNGPLPLEAKDLAKHALAPDTPNSFIHGPINIFPGEAAARKFAAAVSGALQRFPQAVLDSASVTLFGAPSAVDVNDPRLGSAVTTGAAAFALAACATGAAQPPTRSVEVTRVATAIVIPPTPTSTVEATRATPPTATREATRTPSPSATPDSSIKSVKLELNLMAQELTKTMAGQVLLGNVDRLARVISSTQENVLANLDVSYSIDPATKETKYAFANVKAGGGFGALSQTQGLDTGAFVAGDLVFRSKQTDLQNNQYPEIDVDGKLLIVSTGRASIVAGVKVDLVRPDVYKRKFVAFGADGSVVAEASMDINSSPIKNNKGEPLPDWKAVWSVLPAPTAVAGITGTPGSSSTPEQKPTTQAPAEKTPTPAATQAAETVKPTGAYKEVNGSIVWTSFENARDTITPPTIPGLKAQLKGETVVYVDATGKEVGQFNPEVTLTDGTTKRIGGISLNSDEIGKLLQKPENASKIAFPIDTGAVGELRQVMADDGKNPATLVALKKALKINELFGPAHSKAVIGTGPLATGVSYDTTYRSYSIALKLGLRESPQIAFRLLDDNKESQYAEALRDFKSHTLKGHPAYTKMDDQLGEYHVIIAFYDLTDKAKKKNSMDEYVHIGQSLVSQK